MISPRMHIARARYWVHGDRVVKHRVIETMVMGRSAVLVTASFMIVVALVQYWSADSSHLIENYGGRMASYLWATTLLLAALLVWGSHFPRSPKVALVLEIPGTFLLGFGIVAYGFAVWGQVGFLGSVFIISLSWATGLNLFGRALMLVQRTRNSWVVEQQLKGLL